MLREGLSRIGLGPVSDAACASPAVTTIVISSQRSARFGRKLQAEGISAAFRSAYLRDHNAVQFCLMGHAPSEHHVRSLLEALNRAQARHDDTKMCEDEIARAGTMSGD